jgi:hypothetical protein
MAKKRQAYFLFVPFKQLPHPVINVKYERIVSKSKHIYWRKIFQYIMQFGHYIFYGAPSDNLAASSENSVV